VETKGRIKDQRNVKWGPSGVGRGTGEMVVVAAGVGLAEEVGASWKKWKR